MKANAIKWLKPEHNSVTQIIEEIVIEHLLNTASWSARNWVRRNQPTGLEAVIRLLENFGNEEEKTHDREKGSNEKTKGENKMATSGNFNAPRGNVGMEGRREKIGRGTSVNPLAPKQIRPITVDYRLTDAYNEWRGRKEKKGVCFECGSSEHFRRDCPKVDCSWVDSSQIHTLQETGDSSRWEVKAKVNGESKNALIDTGCARTLVRDFKGPVTEDNVYVKCIHGDLKPYVTAWATVEIMGITQRMKIGVVPNLAKEMLIGRDWGLINNLVSKQEGMQGFSAQEETRRWEEMMTATRNRVRLWQQDDTSLTKILQKAKPEGDITKGQEGFIVKNELLYYIDREGNDKLVIPQKWRIEILKLAHNIPLAGHLAVEKMLVRILQRFWWPGVKNDIKKFCQTCPECQLTQHKPKPGSPLIPMPLIDKPFDRIGLDIIGPLPRSSGGHTHVLVMIDYATRYPEAIPLRTTSAKVLARELLQVFSRLGFPKEVLTDQGTNFMSVTFKEMWKILDVKPIRTTVYHPQTNGLVERFNKTLKGMLKKLIMENPRRWHLLVAPLMFAIREVPQSSTGFSPFEMLYGRCPRGILDLIKERWESGEDESQITIKQVLEMREHLRKVSEIAHYNLGKTQIKQKERYDKRIQKREFVNGQKVLLLLPMENAKLFAKWQGPYKVIRRVNEVDYEIEMPDKSKKVGIYHVNLLKEWNEREAFMGEVEDVDLGPDINKMNKEKKHIEICQDLDKDQIHAIQLLEEEFNDVFSSIPGKTNYAEHKIETPMNVVIRDQGRKWPRHLIPIIEEEVKKMLDLDIIETSNSPWRSHPVVVPKKDGSIRFCIDFRKLNSISKFDAYPMPRIEDLLDKLGEAKFLSSLDLTKGYWQVPLRKEDKEKTAFGTPIGLFHFKYMPFGLHGAAATFQRLMDKVLQSVRDFAVAYIDDIIIYSGTWEEHVKHIKLVLKALREANLRVNPDKCKIARKEIKFLGFKVGQGKIYPLQDKVDRVTKWYVPRSKKEVQQFLGLAGYYRHFIPKFSEIAAPLTDLTRKTMPRKVKWGKREQIAFDKLKLELCSQPVRHVPDFNYPFILQTDASERGIGAVLAQNKEGEEHPVLYLSRKLSERERRYATIEKEALAVKWAMHTLKYYLLGAPFILITDHAPLVWLNRMKDINPRLTRWYLSMQPFSFEVKYRKGKANANADYFSRQGPWSEEKEDRTAHLMGGICEKMTEQKRMESGVPSDEKELFRESDDVKVIEREMSQLMRVEKGEEKEGVTVETREAGIRERKKPIEEGYWVSDGEEEDKKGNKQDQGTQTVRDTGLPLPDPVPIEWAVQVVPKYELGWPRQQHRGWIPGWRGSPNVTWARHPCCGTICAGASSHQARFPRRGNF